MNIKPLRADLVVYLEKHHLVKKFKKQLKQFKENPRYPSLHTEILKFQHSKLHSFRVDRKYRVIFGAAEDGMVEIIDINDHYQ